MDRLESTVFDILDVSGGVVGGAVVGGAVVGAGAAPDATTRGLSVRLVAARDWASGASSRSRQLVHGGLRNLKMRDFRLVAEALRERSLRFYRLAPHLGRPVSFLCPLTGRYSERAYDARVDAERDAQQRPKDQTADAGRLGATNIVSLT